MVSEVSDSDTVVHSYFGSFKGDPILVSFVHIILGKVFLMTNLNVSNLFVKQNVSYLYIKMHHLNINTNLHYQ